MTIHNGEMFVSHDYPCPFCQNPANPSPEPIREVVIPTHEQDIHIVAGEVSGTEPLPGEPEPSPSGGESMDL
jgi:hypothetical protein